MIMKTDVYNKTQQRIFYAEAAFEYFVSILVTGAFLTNILNEAGVSDAFSGILSSFVLFTCVAQTASITLNRAGASYKKVVAFLCVADELIFALLYLVPFFDISPALKTAILTVMLLLGLLVLNYTKSSKLNWLISMVPAGERGIFNAKKEMISLITGMILTIGMGSVIDYFKAQNNMKAAFYICCFSIMVFSAMHIITIAMCRKPEPEALPTIRLWDSMKMVFENANFRKLVTVDILWQITVSITSFNGVYQLNTLKFSMTLVSVIVVVGNLARLAISLPFGKLADKTSWAYMMRVSFVLALVSYVVYAFTAPRGGAIMFTLHTVLYNMALAGTSGGLINITFEYIPEELRTTAIGVKFALSGLAGFAMSLVWGAVVSIMQKSGNCIFGFTVYPQQLIAAFCAIVAAAIVIYVSKVILKLKKI